MDIVGIENSKEMKYFVNGRIAGNLYEFAYLPPCQVTGEDIQISTDRCLERRETQYWIVK